MNDGVGEVVLVLLDPMVHLDARLLVQRLEAVGHADQAHLELDVGRHQLEGQTPQAEEPVLLLDGTAGREATDAADETGSCPSVELQDRPVEVGIFLESVPGEDHLVRRIIANEVFQARLPQDHPHPFVAGHLLHRLQRPPQVGVRHREVQHRVVRFETNFHNAPSSLLYRLSPRKQTGPGPRSRQGYA